MARKTKQVCGNPNEHHLLLNCVGFLIALAYVMGVTYVCQTYYAGFKQETEQWGWTNEYFYTVTAMSQHYFVLIGTILVYTPLYYFEIPFFE